MPVSPTELEEGTRMSPIHLVSSVPAFGLCRGGGQDVVVGLGKKEGNEGMAREEGKEGRNAD
jgi:hypothetical protein